MDKNTRKSFLESEIKKHQDLYYNAQPEISDADFDEMWDELKRLDPMNPLFEKVGADKQDGWPKAQHVMMMGSQNKAANPEEFLSWLDKMKPFVTFSRDLKLVVQHKLDGASLELQYEDGILVKAVTRGDGEVGDDITANACKMRGVPKTVPGDFTGAVRGEVLLYHDDYKNFFSDKANCRNAANGLMKRKDGVGVERLRVVCYDLKCTRDDHDFKTEDEKLVWLKHAGFDIVYTRLISYWDIVGHRDEVAATRGSIPYDIDGLVIKLNEVDEDDLAKDRPDRQIAFKFSPEEAITTLLDVEWSESGATYTPIAIVEAVRLAGTTVKRASLANPKIIRELGLQIGSKVVITKRGEIIPKIERAIQDDITRKFITIPHTCACGAQLVNIGTRLYCPSESCPKKKLHRLQKWIKTLDIMEIGDSILQKLTETGRVQNIIDLYTLHIYEIENLDHMGAASAAKIIDNIHKKLKITLPQLIAGFDIEGIGETIVEKIEAAGFDTIEKMRDATVDQLTQIDGVAETTALIFKTGLERVYPDIEVLLIHGPLIIKPKTTGSLASKSFCFTGAMHTLKRPEAEARVKELGGAVKSGVGKGLSYLVTNDPGSGSDKNKKAAELGVKVISEDDFVSMIR
jgi:DNA ligase (NAD+)